jgi:glutaredoxin
MQKSMALFILLGLMLFLSHDVSADEWYRWVDSEGRAIISRKPPPEGSQQRYREAPSQRERQSTEGEVTGRSSIPRVELYSKSWCPACRKARAYFQQRGIPFKEYDVEKDPAAAERRKRIDPGSGVPLAVINGQKILGYSASAYRTALASNP